MEAGFFSELAVRLAVLFAAGSLFSSLLLLALILLLRAWHKLHERGLARRRERWRSALLAAIDDPAGARLPRIGYFDLPEFLSLWNRYQDTVAGVAAQNMATLVRRHGIHLACLRLLRRPSLRVRLVAITALGHLRERRAWRRLRRLSLEPGPVISFAAGRALLRIAPERALEALGAPIAERDDWPLARLGALFRELGPDVVTPALVRMLSAPSGHTPSRVMQLARFGHRARMAPLVRQRMRNSDDVALIVPALDYVEDERDVPWARAAARHAQWRVRLAAAAALGRIGSMADVNVLLRLLGDPVWRVRYQAAQALSVLHGMTRGRLEALRDETLDRFAADMLARTLAQPGPA